MTEHNHVLTGDVVGCPACDKREGRAAFVERRISDEPVMPDLSGFPEVQHRIEGGRFVCPGDRGSRCHQYPGCDCEDWPCGHEYEAHDDCWIKPWIDATYLADSYAGVEFELLLRDENFPDGNVSWSWEGDYVTFDYAPNRTIGTEEEPK